MPLKMLPYESNLAREGKMKKIFKFCYLSLILVAVIASSIQIISDVNAMDQWGNFSPEWKKLDGQDGNPGFSPSVRRGELRSTKLEGDQKLVPCPEPRPQICTQDYRPVCAQLQDGSFKTYSNGCNACTDPAVTSYRDGACE